MLPKLKPDLDSVSHNWVVRDFGGHFRELGANYTAVSSATTIPQCELKVGS